MDGMVILIFFCFVICNRGLKICNSTSIPHIFCGMDTLYSQGSISTLVQYTTTVTLLVKSGCVTGGRLRVYTSLESAIQHLGRAKVLTIVCNARL